VIVPKLNNKLPAGCLPNTNGWLIHLNFFIGPQDLQFWVTVTMVPFVAIPTTGFDDLHTKHDILNIASSILLNTMNFGWLIASVSASTLWDGKSNLVLVLYLQWTWNISISCIFIHSPYWNIFTYVSTQHTFW